MNFLYSIGVAAYRYEEAFWGGKLEFIVGNGNGTHHIVVRCQALIFEKGHITIRDSYHLCEATTCKFSYLSFIHSCFLCLITQGI